MRRDFPAYGRRIPIIAMTVGAFEDNIERREAAGMNAQAAKPIDTGDVMEELAVYARV
jgi:CheY-like chemotaxis protein